MTKRFRRSNGLNMMRLIRHDNHNRAGVTCPRTTHPKGETMILYHTTLKSNLDSIRQHGLSPNFSKGKLPVIWLCTRSKRTWSIVHVQKRHNARLDDIVVIAVKVSRSQLTRRFRGVWTTDRIIDNNRLVSITDASLFARSPAFEEW